MESKLTGVMSDGFVEAMWETLITLATAVAICISVISLSAHLNETRAIRGAAIQSSAVRHAADARLPSGGAGMGAQESAHFN